MFNQFYHCQEFILWLHCIIILHALYAEQSCTWTSNCLLNAHYLTICLHINMNRSLFPAEGSAAYSSCSSIITTFEEWGATIDNLVSPGWRTCQQILNSSTWPIPCSNVHGQVGLIWRLFNDKMNLYSLISFHMLHDPNGIKISKVWHG